MKNDKPIIPLPKEQPKPPAPPPPPTPPAPPKQPGEYSKDNGILFMDKEFNQDNCMPLVKMIIEYNLMPKDKAPVPPVPSANAFIKAFTPALFESFVSNSI